MISKIAETALVPVMVFYSLSTCRKTRETLSYCKHFLKDVVPNIKNESAGNFAEMNEKGLLNTFMVTVIYLSGEKRCMTY